MTVRPHFPVFPRFFPLFPARSDKRSSLSQNYPTCTFVTSYIVSHSELRNENKLSFHQLFDLLSVFEDVRLLQALDVSDAFVEEKGKC
jgi:hypothetical protein